MVKSSTSASWANVTVYRKKMAKGHLRYLMLNLRWVYILLVLREVNVIANSPHALLMFLSRDGTSGKRLMLCCAAMSEAGRCGPIFG